LYNIFCLGIRLEGDHAMARRKRVGFTLVELLVVITIIGMLMALLLPAVNAVRENARKTQCANNIRNVAQALFAFQSAKGKFPGYTGNKIGNLPNSPPTIPWTVAILPNLDRRDIYDQWANNSFVAPSIDVYVCPSDPPDSPGSWLSYVVNAGRPDNVQPNSDKLENGVFFNKLYTNAKSHSADSIYDGPGNTLMLTESVQADRWNPVTPTVTIPVDDSEAFNVSQAVEKLLTFVWLPEQFLTVTVNVNNISYREPVPGYKINGDKFFSGTMDIQHARPSAMHSGGVNVAFADARVTFLREDINYHVYQQLMTANGSFSAGSEVKPDSHRQYVLDSKDYEQ
jgi:prepilin-type N-terminal cleavage/methylation domain-containing protein/prepilin-type processing-associated H-X9-DG protein